eukprot:9473368-Pyramimonas_sp.AAC.1
MREAAGDDEEVSESTKRTCLSTQWEKWQPGTSRGKLPVSVCTGANEGQLSESTSSSSTSAVDSEQSKPHQLKISNKPGCDLALRCAEPPTGLRNRGATEGLLAHLHCRARACGSSGPSSVRPHKAFRKACAEFGFAAVLV